MAQTLLIGLGGTGSRAVNNVVARLRKEGRSVNDGNLCCVVLDTDRSDAELLEKTNTGVPVIPTSKNQTVHRYFSDYKNKGIADWAPEAPALMESDMMLGAAQMRIKSRIAFMDCVESGTINELDKYINRVLTVNQDSKISVMLVSSLSGGTGSGMFIQVALWLRKRLERATVVMRGIFLLPDIFVRTLDRDNREKTKLYANTYAAVRELNAISMARKSSTFTMPQDIELDGLFNSRGASEAGKGVLDFAFFLDDMDANGITLSSLPDYENAVADLIYMQMYAPLTGRMYSAEDNYFLDNALSLPLYGSCGTARAIYPADDVLRYCALRAVQDSLKGGWRKIDDEIDEKLKEIDRRVDEGYRREELDPNKAYITIFQRETDRVGDEAMDPFFAAAADDAGRVQGSAADRVTAFVKGISDTYIKAALASYKPDRYQVADNFAEAERSVEELIDLFEREDAQGGLNTILRNFDNSLDRHVDDVLNLIMPYNMSENMERATNTVMSLFTKKIKDQTVFVHPVAAKYMLLRLCQELEDARKGLAEGAAAAKVIVRAVTHEELPVFDNEGTKKQETTPLEYLESKKWYQGEEKFTNIFEEKYAEYVNTKVINCKKYLEDTLRDKVFENLLRRLEGLVHQFNLLFGELKKVKEDVAVLLEEAAAPGNVGNKNLLVYARPEHKEAVYRSLRMNLNGGRGINKSVVTTVYGKLCAEKRPSYENNQKYADLSLAATFTEEARAFFEQAILEKPEYREEVYKDIYQAICAESDFGITGQESVQVKTARHHARFTDYIHAVERNAAPFLQYITEDVNDAGLRQEASSKLWGFNPVLLRQIPDLAGKLKGHTGMLQSDQYPANEISCYRGVYNLRAEQIPAFSETGGGKYYESYQTVISSMLEQQRGSYGDEALMATPHLDKRWHKILPYISTDMEQADSNSFYHGFWLAVAYGRIVVDKEGNFCVKKATNPGNKDSFRKAQPVLLDGKPVPKRNVVDLLKALELDAEFMGFELPDLEARFKEELERVSTYEDMEVLKGLRGSMNAVDLVVRYNRSKGAEVRVLGALIDALKEIAEEMALNYHDNSRTKRSLLQAQYKILFKIYDPATLTKEKADIFVDWLQKFVDLGLAKPNAVEETEEPNE